MTERVGAERPADWTLSHGYRLQRPGDVIEYVNEERDLTVRLRVALSLAGTDLRYTSEVAGSDDLGQPYPVEPTVRHNEMEEAFRRAERAMRRHSAHHDD